MSVVESSSISSKNGRCPGSGAIPERIIGVVATKVIVSRMVAAGGQLSKCTGPTERKVLLRVVQMSIAMVQAAGLTVIMSSEDPNGPAQAGTLPM